jgi:hypothetical protein
VQLSVKCRYCDILLAGKDQFMGHMFHNHELDHERLEVAWKSIAAMTCGIDSRKILQVEARQRLAR